jgi:hypothetical protein
LANCCWERWASGGWKKVNCEESVGAYGDFELIHGLFFSGIDLPTLHSIDRPVGFDPRYETVYIARVNSRSDGGVKQSGKSQQLHQSLNQVLESLPGYRLLAIAPRNYWPLEPDVDWSSYVAVLIR